MSERRYGYYAVDRGVFHNPILRNAEWFRAWQWLIAYAAWRVESGIRVGRTTVALKRGQIASTIRMLASEWNWSKGAVEYFLDRLMADKMIELQAIRTRMQTRSGGKDSLKISLITICNYDKFQKAVKPQYAGSGHRVGQSVGQEQGLLPCIGEEIGSEPLKQTNNKESGAKKMLTKPGHCKISGDGSRIWFDHLSSEWCLYAADYLEVHGVALPTELRIGGSGNWFYKAGAISEPRQKRRKRA